VPVITLDQPLYAIAKSIQWNWQAEYKPATAKTCDEYSIKVFISFINNQLQHVSRVDIV